MLLSHFHLLFKLFIFCRYLATGTTFTALHYDFRLGISTIRKIVLSVCNALWNTLKNEFFPDPTEERWRELSGVFRKCSHLPNCLEAIDVKHITVTKFPRSGSVNLSYKYYYSIVLMAVADSDYKFTYFDIGAYGKDCDSSVFQETSFFKLMIRNKLHIPPSGTLFTYDTENFPFFFFGDETFSLSESLMRACAGYNLSEKQSIFNYRLCRARIYVEGAFGILSNKWRILHTALNVSKEFSKDIVKACVLLHNLVQSKDGYRSEEMYMTQNWNSVNRAACSRTRRNASDVRDRFADYFVSREGALPWQMNKF